MVKIENSGFDMYRGSSKTIVVMFLVLSIVYFVLSILRVFRRKGELNMGVSLFHPIVEIMLRTMEVDMAPFFMTLLMAICLGATFIPAVFFAYAGLIPMIVIIVGQYMKEIAARQKFAHYVVVGGKVVNLLLISVIVAHIWIGDLQFKP